MSVFDAGFLSDAEVWSRLVAIAEERSRVRRLLAQPEVSTDPDRLPDLARQLHELDRICSLADELKSGLDDRRDWEAMLAEASTDGKDDELRVAYEESAALCNQVAGQLYRLLLEKGYLDEEIEDDTDLEILRFIDYAGPEYAWRLGINIGIDVVEARERLERLLGKGLLKKVQGTMLGNYHRQKDWTKHMNHTYFRISRAGKLYLRRLRRIGKPGMEKQL